MNTLHIGDKNIASQLKKHMDGFNEESKLFLLQVAINHLYNSENSESKTSNEDFCKELILRLSSIESLRVIQYLLSSLYPPSDTQIDAAEALKKYLDYDFRKHLDYLGIEYPTPSENFMENLKLVTNCLKEYKLRLQKLEGEVKTALDTLGLVAQVEDSTKNTNWQGSKNGRINRLALKIAVQARDLLQLCYKQGSKKN